MHYGSWRDKRVQRDEIAADMSPSHLRPLTSPSLPEQVAFSNAITALTRAGHSERALKLFDVMGNEGVCIWCVVCDWFALRAWCVRGV